MAVYVADRTRRPFALHEGMTFLARTPIVLDSLLRHLPAPWAMAHEGGQTWSALDIVGHLIHGERTNWLPRISMLLEHGESRAFDSFDRFAQEQERQTTRLDERLDTFARLRGDSLAAVRALELTEGDLFRRGTHPAFGSVTLRQLLTAWVAHDLDHIMQATRVLGRQYADEVGPWRAYLRVVSGEQG